MSVFVRTWHVVLCTAVLLCLPGTLSAQTPPAPISDNSFLIEEAYNQDRGVVQHISSFVRPTRGSEFVYTFVQEWPVGGMQNQLS